MRRGSKKGGDEVQASVHEKMVVLQLHPLTPAHAIYISISASKQSLTIPTLTRNNLVFFQTSMSGTTLPRPTYARRGGPRHYTRVTALDTII